MINIYVGPAIGNVINLHGLQGHDAQVLREHHLPRWRRGGLTGAVMQISDWATLGMLVSEAHRSEGEITLCRSRADYETRPEGSFGLFFSVEGYQSFAGDFDAIHLLAELGATAYTFSHNAQNLLCTGAGDRIGDGGFTHLGKATLEVLEHVPLIVDLVHTSRAAFWDALDIYSGDILVSHSNADAVCPHPRNITDDQIKAVAERNGVIGVNSYRGYVAADPYKATLSDLLDHAMHMVELVGPEHVALGNDFWEGPMEILDTTMSGIDPDGSLGLQGSGALYATGPEGFEDIGKLGKVIAGLAERGLSQADLDLITGGSYLALLERSRPSTPTSTERAE
ncbi:MAG TPA: membrane dipeptidase [Mycobacteriales bacterium]|nr:membrane dipeptidase [Mycobacteriales bacterium]